MSNLIYSLYDLIVSNFVEVSIFGFILLIVELLPIKKNPSLMEGLWFLVIIKLFIPQISVVEQLQYSFKSIDLESGVMAINEFVPQKELITKELLQLYYLLMISSLILLTIIKESYFLLKVGKLTKGYKGGVRYLDIDAPFCYGILRPVIVLPKFYKNRDIKPIIDHETAHIKFYDNIKLIFLTFTQILNFFNPIIYIAGHYIKLHMEERADNYALNQSKISTKGYCALLLDNLEERVLYGSRLKSAFIFSKSQIKQRLIYLTRQRKGDHMNMIKTTLILVTISAIFLNFNLTAETVKKVKKVITPKTEVKKELVTHDFFHIEKPPKLIGEMKSFYQNLKYPTKARKEAKNGKVIIKLIVLKDGTPSNIEIIKEEPKGFDFGKNSIEAIKKCRFVPGEHKGEKVNTVLKLPAQFKVK